MMHEMRFVPTSGKKVRRVRRQRLSCLRCQPFSCTVHGLDGGGFLVETILEWSHLQDQQEFFISSPFFLPSDHLPKSTVEFPLQSINAVIDNNGPPHPHGSSTDRKLPIACRRRDTTNEGKDG